MSLDPKGSSGTTFLHWPDNTPITAENAQSYDKFARLVTLYKVVKVICSAIVMIVLAIV